MPGTALGTGERTENGLRLHFVGRTVEMTGTVRVKEKRKQRLGWTAWGRMYEIKFCVALNTCEMPIKIQTDMSTGWEYIPIILILSKDIGLEIPI